MAARTLLSVAFFAAALFAAAPVRAGDPEGADPNLDLARKAVTAIRAAGMDPAKEVQYLNMSAAVLSFPAQAVIQKTGLPLEAIGIAIKAHPEVLTEGAGATPTGVPPTPPPPPPPPPNPPNPKKDPAPPPVEPGNAAKPPEPPAPPPAGAATGGGHGPADGVGQNARGSSGAAKTVPANAAAIAAAVKSNANVRVEAGDIDTPYNAIKIGDNVTLDGGGATLWMPGTGHNGTGIIVQGKSVILRNLRVRNPGDGVDFGTSGTPPSSDVLVENVTVSGSGDDGFAPSYKCNGVTIRWSAVYGCTRGVFIKYGGTNVTMHHSIVSHFWMRAPLISGSVSRCDFRNNLIQHWSMTASQPDQGAQANFVNSTYRFDKAFDAGKADAAITLYQGGGFYTSGNEFIGCSQRQQGQVPKPFEAPPINGETDAKTALDAVLSDTAGAGCMPRDAIDKAYLALQVKWPARPSDKTVTHGLQVPETEKRLKAK